MSADTESGLQASLNEDEFVCPHCNKRLANKHGLIRHIRTHTGDKPFSCVVCSKSFADRQYLVLHTRMHTGERPYSCDQCDKRFSSQSNLIQHSKVHKGVRPYKCSQCQRRFTQLSGLKCHMRTHTGERPFPCGICGRRFAQLTNMKKHQASHMEGVDENGFMDGYEYQQVIGDFKEENIDCYPMYSKEMDETACTDEQFDNRHDQDFEQNVDKWNDQHSHYVDTDFQENSIKPSCDNMVATDVPQQRNSVSDKSSISQNCISQTVEVKRHKVRNSSKIMAVANALGNNVYDTIASVMPESDEEFTAEEEEDDDDNYNEDVENTSITQGSIDDGSSGVSYVEDCNSQLFSSQRLTSDVRNISADSPVKDNHSQAQSNPELVGHSHSSSGVSGEAVHGILDQCESGVQSGSSSETLCRTVSGSDECVGEDSAIEDRSDSEERDSGGGSEETHVEVPSDNPDVEMGSTSDQKMQQNQSIRKQSPSVVDLLTQDRSDESRVNIDSNDLSPPVPESSDEKPRASVSLPLLTSPMVSRLSRSSIDASFSSGTSGRVPASRSYTSPMFASSSARPWTLNRAPISMMNSAARRRGRPPRLQIPLGGEVVVNPSDTSKQFSYKPFRCKICTKFFSTLGNLKQHLNIHTGMKPYTCSVCPRSFSSKGGLLQHTATHTNARPHVCNICFKGFNQSGNLRTHQRIHTGERPYKCPVCGKGFGNIGNMRTHARTHGHVFPVKEPVITAAPVADSRNVSSDERRSESELFLSSQNTPGSRENIDSESETSHTDNLSPRNSISTGAYSKEIDLDAQIFNARVQRRLSESFASLPSKPMTMHGAGNLMQSPLAGSVNSQMLYSMAPGGQYTLISTPDVPSTRPQRRFICSVCMKDFAAMSSLEIHMTTHTGEKRYECTICARKFAQTGTLKVHMRTHTGEKPYACTVCDKRFSQSGSLDVHLKTHLPDRYPCEKCGEKFPRMMSLRQHDLTVHCDYLSSDESKPNV